MTKEEFDILFDNGIFKAIREGKQIVYGDTNEPADIHSIFNGFGLAAHKFKVKPEPELRPWRPEEVPVGALIRWKSEVREQFTGSQGFDICIIQGISGYRLLTGIPFCNFTFNTVLKNHEHSLDHGKTWLPCGVQE